MLGALRSKFDSRARALRSIFQVYDNWLGVLKVYFLGGETIASLHDLRHGRLPIRVSKDNVERIISLGSVLAEFQSKYEVRNGKIKLKPCRNIIATLRPDFTLDEVSSLKLLCSLSKYGAGIARFNDNHYLVTDIDGIKWIVRRESSTSLRSDILFGPLLSCYQEPREYKWFSNALDGGGTFVDVGANVGGYSVRACEMGARVVAVEPDPDNFRVLRLNLELNHCTNAHVLNIAAGSHEEVRQLYRAEDGFPAGYTLLQGEVTGGIKCSVEAKPLDVALAPLLCDEWISLLKVDVEGVEVEVIKSALNLLKRTRYVIVEVIPGTRSKILQVLDLLRPLGFKLIDKVCRRPYCDLFLRRSV